MKIKYLVIIFIIILFGCSSLADVVTTQRKIRPQQEQKQTPPKIYNTNRPTSNAQVHKRTPQNPLANNIKMCKPYSETLSANYMGMNMNYKVSIEGWINNKCRLNFVANVGGASNSFSSIYGLNPSDVTVLSFAPKIQCNFTKQQLEYVGDSILQENERNNGATNNMLKDPNNISLTNISASDQKLLDVVLNQQACTLLNTGDLNNIMQMLY